MIILLPRVVFLSYTLKKTIMEKHYILSDAIKKDTDDIIQKSVSDIRAQSTILMKNFEDTQNMMINDMIAKMSNILLENTFSYVERDDEYLHYTDSRFDIIYLYINDAISNPSTLLEIMSQRLNVYIKPRMAQIIDQYFSMAPNEKVIFRYNACFPKYGSHEGDGLILIFNVTDAGNIVFGNFTINALYNAQPEFFSGKYIFKGDSIAIVEKPTVIMNNIKLHHKYIRLIQKLSENSEMFHYTNHIRSWTPYVNFISDTDDQFTDRSKRENQFTDRSKRENQSSSRVTIPRENIAKTQSLREHIMQQSPLTSDLTYSISPTIQRTPVRRTDAREIKNNYFTSKGKCNGTVPMEFLVSYIQEVIKLNKEYCCRFINTYETQNEYDKLIATNNEKDIMIEKITAVNREKDAIIEELIAANKEKEAMMEELTVQLKYLKDHEEPCCVCFERANKNKVLIPCGHRQYCDECVTRLDGKCAICRAGIGEIVDIY